MAFAPGLPGRRARLLRRRHAAAAHRPRRRRPTPSTPGSATRTAGLIKQIVDPGDFSDATILAVVNTVHVKAAWQAPFDAARTRPAPFTLADGTTVQVPTMSGPVTGPVAQTPAYDAVALATKGPVTAWVVVPRAGQTPESLLALFARRGLDSLYGAARSTPVMLELPRLHTTFSAPDLKPELQAMGMVSAFSPQTAELQGIVAPDTQGRVYIERVVHKAVLNVNENGVEAAAATAGIVGVSAAPFAPLTISADHPFLLLLTDKGTVGAAVHGADQGPAGVGRRRRRYGARGAPWLRALGGELAAFGDESADAQGDDRRVGRFSADDGRSVDPQNGYGSPLSLKLAASTLTISRHGDRYVGVIATPSLPSLPPNTLVLRPVSKTAGNLLATPAPLTRIALHALGPDSFSYVCRVRAGGVWTLFSTMTFHRIGSPA